MAIHACLIESVEPWMIWLNVPAASTGSSTPPPTNLQLQLTFWTQHRLSLCTLLPRVPTVPLCVYHIHIANEDERGESIAPRQIMKGVISSGPVQLPDHQWRVNQRLWVSVWGSQLPLIMLKLERCEPGHYWAIPINRCTPPRRSKRCFTPQESQISRHYP